MARQLASLLRANSETILEQWQEHLGADSPFADELPVCFDTLLRIISRRDCEKFRDEVERILHAAPGRDAEPSELLAAILLFVDAAWPTVVAEKPVKEAPQRLQALWKCASLVSCTFVALARQHTDRQMDEHLRQLEDMRRRIRMREITDPLTGMHSHRHIQELLEEECERARRYDAPLSFLLLDVDGFTEYNNTYGHSDGDQLLLDIADLIFRDCRRVDQPARFAADTFAIILPETGVKDARRLAGRLLTEIDEADSLGPHCEAAKAVTVSCGLSGASAAAAARKAMVDAALQALSEAKEAGGNTVVTIEC
jgi:diguanylate cyclase (GGDEF)-like protein